MSTRNQLQKQVEWKYSLIHECWLSKSKLYINLSNSYFLYWSDHKWVQYCQSRLYRTYDRNALCLSLSLSQNHHTGVYTGFIKVQMDLRRPVTVRGGQRGAGGALVEEAFYLPRGVTNTLHISSNNTVRQVANTHAHAHTYTASAQLN